MDPGDVGRNARPPPPAATLASSQRSRSSCSSGRRRRRRPGAPGRRGRRTAVRSRPGRGRRRRPTCGAPARRSARPRRRRWRRSAARVRASTARTTSSMRPSLEPKWYSSMRWLVPTASAMRRRLWSASPSAVKCSITASSRRSRADGAGDCPGMYQMVHSEARTETRATRRQPMAQQVIDADGDDDGGPGGGLRAPGRRRRRGPSGRPSAPSSSIEPGDGTPEGLGRGPPLHDRAAQEPRAGRRAHARARSSPTCSRRGWPLRDYRAVVTLDARRRAGTAIHWRSTFRRQGARHGLDLPAPAGQVHRPRPWTGWPPAAARGRAWPSPEGPAQFWPVSAAFSPRRCSAPSRLTKARRSWERDSCRAGSASPRRPRRPSSRVPEAVDGQAGLEEHRRRLREVDGGQLEEAVAVVGHHHLGRRVGQLGPHGVDRGLGLGLGGAPVTVP